MFHIWRKTVTFAVFLYSVIILTKIEENKSIGSFPACHDIFCRVCGVHQNSHAVWVRQQSLAHVATLLAHLGELFYNDL
jgi:hypothetical protein